jgi:hypothetical protein
MDFTDALKAGGASATLIAIVGIIIKIIQSTCGHRIRSECCGRTATIGVKVEAMNSPKPTSDESKPDRSARPSLETKADHTENSVIEHKPAAAAPEPLPVEIQARV